MKILTLTICLLSFVVQAEEIKTAAITPETLSKSWQYQGIIVNEPGWDLWGASPVIDEKGRCHLFIARWPGKIPFNQGWRNQCEIARYSAPGPEGPFTYQETVIKPDPKREGWAKIGYHNPNIQRLKDGRYALTYIARPSMQGQPGNQRIDMLIADSPEGPWKLANGDPSKPMLDTPKDASVWCGTKPRNGVCNPALLEMPNGKFHLYFKSAVGGKAVMGVAIADQVEGPYIFHKKPITQNQASIEDGYAFLWNGEVNFVTTDNHGIIENGGGLLWRSREGIHFDPKPLQGFPRFDKAYLKDADKSKFKSHYSKAVKFERPQILCIEGKPKYLYVPCGVATDGSDGTNVYLLKINH